jgi:hypothetical protein
MGLTLDLVLGEEPLNLFLRVIFVVIDRPEIRVDQQESPVAPADRIGLAKRGLPVTTNLPTPSGRNCRK